MKKTCFVALLSITLLCSIAGVTSQDDEFDTIYFSDQLNVGDKFSWNILQSNFGEFPTGHIISIEIMKSLDFDILEDYDNINSAFKWFKDNESFDVLDEDIFFAFISPTDITYSNGTTANIADFLWIALVYDDFYFGDHPYTTETSGNIVTYNGTIEYNEREKGVFEGSIDRRNGIVQHLHFYYELAGATGDELEIELVGGNGLLNLFGLPFNLAPFIVSLGIITLLIRRRKYH